MSGGVVGAAFLILGVSMVASGGLWLGWRGAVMVLEAGGMPWEVASKTRRAGWALVSIGLILVAAALGAVEGFNP